MTVLYVVPNAYLQKFRRSLGQEGEALVMTLPGLVAHVLKEGLISYKEDSILQEAAIWQSVQEHVHDLDFFAPIAHYPGFIQELSWLFKQIDLGEEVFRLVLAQGQTELKLLHGCYHRILAAHGILSPPQQINKALQLSKQDKLFPEAGAIKILGLGELSPLENEFLQSFAHNRPLEIVQSGVEHPVIDVLKAPDPMTEVKMIGEALREQIKKGIPLDKLGVAFPNPAKYLPIFMQVFNELKIPWRIPNTSLKNTPLGKTILNLIAGELEGWHKHHLTLLTAPGWGYPFDLNNENHRKLRLAPPLKGLPAWRSYLGEEAAWVDVLTILDETASKLITRPLREYGLWLENLLGKLNPETWALPAENLEHWAELVKAWDGLQVIAESLKKYEWTSSPSQFWQLLQSLLDTYQIQARRVFHEQVQIMSIEKLGAYTYEKLYVGGLVEGQFPQYKHAHWLTKTKTMTQREELYDRLTRSASEIYLYYPEVDKEGKLNLPATILPKKEEETRIGLPQEMHHPSLFLGNGLLRDQDLLLPIQKTILTKGLSVSQLNRYANCPYQFFCGFVLDLIPDEEESLELDARDHGNIIHQVLQYFWTEHMHGPLPAVEEGQTQIEGLLRREYAKEGVLPAAKLVRTMRNFMRRDLNMVEKGFRPKFLEKRFQGLSIQTALGPVEIRGRIDRIDVHPEGAYVLYDYKTGTAPSLVTMLAGGDIQMAAYLLAAQDLLPQGRNVGAAYYLTGKGTRPGIFHQDFHETLEIRKDKNVLDDESFGVQLQTFQQMLEGLIGKMLNGEFPIEPSSDQICKYCSFQGICRKEAWS